jgi:hypothetical protein
MFVAIGLSVALIGIAVVSLRFQIRNIRRLTNRSPIPSDERRYLRGLTQRRILNSFLMLVLGGMIIGAYASGYQARFEEIAKFKDLDPPVEATDDDRAFMRTWAMYWIVVLVLLFFVVTVAIVDYVATSLYARQQLRRIQSEQRTLLERDLAVYRAQRENDRMRRKS